MARLPKPSSLGQWAALKCLASALKGICLRILVCVVSECDATLSAYEGSLDQAHASWVRVDEKSKAFMTKRKGGPARKHVKRRVTVDLGTNQVIEDIDINAPVEDAWLHRQLPEGVSGTRTKIVPRRTMR